MKSLKESLSSISLVSFSPRGIIGTSTCKIFDVDVWLNMKTVIVNVVRVVLHLIELNFFSTFSQLFLNFLSTFPQFFLNFFLTFSHLRVVLHLIELNGAVELRELLLQQLQVRVHEAQLQRDRLLHLLVC